MREGVQSSSNSNHRHPNLFCGKRAPQLVISTTSIWLVCLSVCLFVCLFVSNKRQNGWTDRAQIICGTSRDHREGLWMIKISNICLHQNSIFIKFLKILKIHEIFCENPRINFVLFYDVHMFTINLEDGKASINKFCCIWIIIMQKISWGLDSIIRKKSVFTQEWIQNLVLVARGTNCGAIRGTTTFG